MKRNDLRPVSLSSRTSEPRISAGIRSGVHWMRLSSRPRIVPRVSTSRVLARPGTPISRACPPHNRVIKACSTTSRWPKMISPIRSRTRLRRPPSASTWGTRSSEEGLMGAVEFKQSDPSSKTTAGSSLMQKPNSSNSQPAGPEIEARRAPIGCGDLEMRIARDGTWFYRGSPIGRVALVKLFASVLRREADGRYWLVTPVERGLIEVEDVPFLGVALTVEGQGRFQNIIFRTNLDEFVTAGPDNPLRVATAADGEPAPYILVRESLEARLSRPVFYDLVELGSEERVGSTIQFGVW